MSTLKKPYSKIVVIGSASYDSIMEYPGVFRDQIVPEKLSNLNLSFVAETLERQIGGTGVNIAYNLSLATDFPTSLVAAVGKDGVDILDFLKAQQIDTKFVLQDPNLYSAYGNVITDSEKNQLWGFYYGACEKAQEINMANVFDQNSLAIISANHPRVFLYMQKACIAAGVDYLYDPGMALSWITDVDLAQGIKHAKSVVGNEYEIHQIEKRLGLSHKQMAAGGREIIKTKGAGGVHYVSEHEEVFAPAIDLSEVVDPTGAGDAWRAGYLAGIVSGSSLSDSLFQGNALASFAIQKKGAIKHKPSRENIKRRMNQINSM